MLQRSKKSRNSRVAIHADCGASTKIAGGDFVHTCDPIGPDPEIECDACKRLVTASEFSWEDSGENIGMFRKRLHQSIPIPSRFLLSRTFVIGCLTIALTSRIVDVYYDHKILLVLQVTSLTCYILGSLMAYFLIGCINYTDVE